MVEVDIKDLKRKSIYMIYLHDEVECKKSLYFFTFRGYMSDSLIEMILYGRCIYGGDNEIVYTNFWKIHEAFTVPKDVKDVRLFELTFKEFSYHVVSETI